mmetsp:Transcript_26800/g.85273  ORF Transcript_26800/g.85273 Transcript_26800/m.85273 type:complete len:219 (-) Transcript_26800:1760-2416(-)
MGSESDLRTASAGDGRGGRGLGHEAAWSLARGVRGGPRSHRPARCAQPCVRRIRAGVGGQPRTPVRHQWARAQARRARPRHGRDDQYRRWVLGPADDRRAHRCLRPAGRPRPWAGRLCSCEVDRRGAADERDLHPLSRAQPALAHPAYAGVHGRAGRQVWRPRLEALRAILQAHEHVACARAARHSVFVQPHPLHQAVLCPGRGLQRGCRRRVCHNGP